MLWSPQPISYGESNMPRKTEPEEIMGADFRNFLENGKLNRNVCFIIQKPRGPSGQVVTGKHKALQASIPSYHRSTINRLFPFASAVTAKCPTCRSHETFVAQDSLEQQVSDGTLALLVFRCPGCKKQTKTYLFHIKNDGTTYTKCAEYPPKYARPAKEIAAYLKTLDLDKIYQKGMECENHGLGIAAHAYYRRVVEVIINALLDKHVDGWRDDTNRPRIQDRINMISEALDSEFGLNNTFNTLYTTLSEGIHSLADEDCLVEADILRQMLVNIISQVQAQEGRKARDKALSDALNARKGRRNQNKT